MERASLVCAGKQSADATSARSRAACDRLELANSGAVVAETLVEHERLVSSHGQRLAAMPGTAVATTEAAAQIDIVLRQLTSPAGSEPMRKLCDTTRSRATNGSEPGAHEGLTGVLASDDARLSIMMTVVKVPWKALSLVAFSLAACSGSSREHDTGDAKRSALARSVVVSDTGLTAGIGRVEPEVCEGARLRIEGSFPATQPTDRTVYFEPCGVPGHIESWTSSVVEVTVPPTATTGCVWFGAERGGNPFAFGLGPSGSSVLSDLAAAGLVTPAMLRAVRAHWDRHWATQSCTPLCVGTAAAPRNHVAVVRPPSIVRLETVRGIPSVDAPGQSRPALQYDDACTQTRLRWTAAGAETAELGRDGVRLLAGLGPMGDAPVNHQLGRHSYTLTARNACGEATRQLDVFGVNLVQILPNPALVDPMSVDNAGKKKLTVDVVTSCPLQADWTVRLVNSDPTRMSFPATIAIPAGARQATFDVTTTEASADQPIGTIRWSGSSDQDWPPLAWPGGPDTEVYVRSPPDHLESTLDPAALGLFFNVGPQGTCELGKLSFPAVTLSGATVSLDSVTPGDTSKGWNVVLRAPTISLETQIGATALKLTGSAEGTGTLSRGNRIDLRLNLAIEIRRTGRPDVVATIEFPSLTSDGPGGQPLHNGDVSLFGVGTITGGLNEFGCDSAAPVRALVRAHANPSPY